MTLQIYIQTYSTTAKKSEKKNLSRLSVCHQQDFCIRTTDFLVHVVFKCLKYSHNKGAKKSQGLDIYPKRVKNIPEGGNLNLNKSYLPEACFYRRRSLQNLGLFRIKSM